MQYFAVHVFFQKTDCGFFFKNALTSVVEGHTINLQMNCIYEVWEGKSKKYKQYQKRW